MSMQIRTVVKYNPDEFDRDVNYSIADGWKLTKRELLQSPAGLYAELVKEDEKPQPEPAPITWQQAVETLKGICSSREDCLTNVKCPMYDFCHSIDPSDCPCDWPEVPHD